MDVKAGVLSTTQDNIDRFGHCVCCHRNMITKRVVDGKVVEMFLPDHGHTDFLLNNGSIMKVCMCRTCREKVNLKDPIVQKYVMEACLKGWELETKSLIADPAFPGWTEESGKVYLDRMAKLSIDMHSEEATPMVVQNRVKELTKIMAAEIEERKIKNSKEVEIIKDIDAIEKEVGTP